MPGIAAGYTRRPHVPFARQIRDCLHKNGGTLSAWDIRYKIAKSRWHAKFIINEVWGQCARMAKAGILARHAIDGVTIFTLIGDPDLDKR